MAAAFGFGPRAMVPAPVSMGGRNTTLAGDITRHFDGGERGPIGLTAASLDGPGGFKPALDRFVGDAQPWDLTGFIQISAIHAAMMNAELTRIIFRRTIVRTAWPKAIHRKLATRRST
jgi:hypothetical protein